MRRRYGRSVLQVDARTVKHYLLTIDNGFGQTFDVNISAREILLDNEDRQVIVVDGAIIDFGLTVENIETLNGA